MLTFDSIHYAFDAEPVLRGVSFSAAAGEITCLIGPSGCGKTTLLRLAAGLLDAQAGEIRLDGDVLCKPGFNLPPEDRPVGLVFQEGALFPHLTVAGNVGVGLTGAGREARVQALLALVGLADFGRRYPHTLSGGQRQRVALARALAPSPRALLFDEPYANLDSELRRALREEARRMVRSSGTIGIFITHDPEDVTALADRVVVLTAGEVVQVGTPRELYDHPETSGVVRLFGQAQRVIAELAGDRLKTRFGSWPTTCLYRRPTHSPSNGPAGSPAAVELNVRPDGLILAPDEAGLPVAEIRVAGADDLIGVAAADGTLLFVRQSRPHGFEPGGRVRVTPRRSSVFAVPIESLTNR